MITKTSQTSPILIAEIGIGSGAALLGLTLCPGKKDPARGWSRDLAQDLAAIRAWGASTVVTLIEDHEFPLLDVRSLGRDVRRLRMDWMHLPIPDVDVPQASFEAAWPLASRLLHERIAAGERILIHCRGGLGRSGLVAGRLLVEQGCDPRVAVHRVRAARPGAIETSAQERYVLQSRPADALDEHAVRVLGSLLAGAAGDAAGYLVEFDDIGAIRRQHGPEGMRLGDLILEPLPASDDTQMTLFTVEGLLAARSAGKTSADEIEHCIREAYLDWFGTQRPTSRRPVGMLARDRRFHHNRAPGMTCISALQCGGGSLSILPGLRLNDSKGCGTVMRTAPIGWFRDWTVEAAFDLGMRASAITHSHPTGYIAGGAMAAMVRLLVDGHSLLDAANQARALAAGVTGGEETVAAIDAAIKLAGSASPASPETVETLGGGWVAEEALAVGLYAALRGDTMSRTLEIGINHSGDSDSTASIAGQLRGAAEGIRGIPFDLLRKIDLLDPILEMANRVAD
jgi:ADP-ribosylglycohydrolase/protein-tyrosine phosphatase